MLQRYQIIEDCSPYYIRFTYDGIEKFNEYALNIFNTYDWIEPKTKRTPKFSHKRLDPVTGQKVLDNTILTEDISINVDLVRYFESLPGLYYHAHKDGQNHRFSINHTIKILDDKCVTNWYSDEDLKIYPVDTDIAQYSRELIGFKKENHTPIKSMIAKPNECILFNTDIYHDWDNSTSSNQRVVLTLRTTTPSDMYFDDAKRFLFKGKI
jgi:hypothetical protein